MVELLEVTVWDSDEFMNDKCLGVVEIDIAEDVAKVPGGRIYKTWYLQVRSVFVLCGACVDGMCHLNVSFCRICKAALGSYIVIICILQAEQQVTCCLPRWLAALYVTMV